MSAQNPTSEDLRTIAANMFAEGQTSRVEALTNVAELLEGLQKKLLLYRRAVALLRILRAEVPGNMFVTYEAGTGRNYRDLCDELLAEIDGKETK